uniref:PITH domain-containing protein n=1 Tax=Physcomitrium patens TaxID=3218 RepID=A0A7I4FSC8_PHYPA
MPSSSSCSIEAVGNRTRIHGHHGYHSRYRYYISAAAVGPDWLFDSRGDVIVAVVVGTIKGLFVLSVCSGPETSNGIVQIDLADCIEWQSVECLNENTAHTFVNALKQIIAPHSTWIRCIAHLCCQGYREDNGLHLESDADEQLLLFIPFNQVKLHSLIIRGPPEEGPRTLKLFANRPNMGFSNVTDYPPNDTVIASLEDLEVSNIPNLSMRGQCRLNTSSFKVLTVFVEDN